MVRWTTLPFGLWALNVGNTLSFLSARAKNNLGVFKPRYSNVLEVFLQMIRPASPLGRYQSRHQSMTAFCVLCTDPAACVHSSTGSPCIASIRNSPAFSHFSTLSCP